MIGRRIALLLWLCVMVESHTYAYKTFLPREDWAKVIKAFLPNPPDSGSLMEAYDRECLIQGKCLREGERGRQACEDARWSVEVVGKCFSAALGVEISLKNTPQLCLLLEKTMNDAGNASGSVKHFYGRIRPYVACNEGTLVPEEEESHRKSPSYPSAHACAGWTMALVLAQVCPESMGQLLARGWEYGQSRVISGYHWQSDVDAARIVASAVYCRLQTDKGYKRQLARACKELIRYKRKMGGKKKKITHL